MTNEQYLRYFEKRPKTKEIHLVGSVVFTDKEVAEKYAAQVDGTVDTKTKKDLQDEFEKEKLNLQKLSKEEAELKLKGITLSKNSDYNELAVLMEALGLTADGKSKKAYLAVLKVAQEALLANTGNDGDATPDANADKTSQTQTTEDDESSSDKTESTEQS